MLLSPTGATAFGRGRLELVHHRLRQPSAVRIHQPAEIALQHAGRWKQTVLIQVVAPVLRLDRGEPEGLVLSVIDFRDVDRAARRQRELVVFQRRHGPVRRWPA